ncbi:MAG: 1-deoxy-D-xylulose-5-phosphate synthase [Endomicrobia bacterium]|nr:1-deoxy-D-xylulose-5-phosphate synthase [Endomicrobiia bacterium]
MKLIDNINFPADIKKLNFKELKQLCDEIRELIVETVSKTGGHLASNLGAVELTVALHYVFDTPRDKIVWDVGHQTYAHKILTGRKDVFHKLRQYNGISGFPRREESEYDSFNVGHASTAVSAALGMVVARELKGDNYKVIAVIGDGSLSGGLTYEGLNHAGHLGYDFIVVLNDNAMFISRSVGAIAKMLVKLLTLGLVKKIETKIDKFLRRMRYAGQAILRVAKRFKLLLFPGMLFEEMGFAYIGPVDGHDIKELIEVFKNISYFKGPVVVHIVTKKGKGYPPAETTPEKYHGVAPFDVYSGKFITNNSNKQTFTEVFSKSIVSIAKENKKIVGITAAMMEGCGLEEFAKFFPERFFDVGIAEEHAVTFAAGLAVEGFIPVCAIYSTFLQRAFDQIIHDVALQNLHIIFMLDRAGIVGEDGPTHHGMFDISYLRLIPNMTIFVPKNGEELKNMFYTAVYHIKGPVAIRYPKDFIPDSEEINYDKYEIVEPAKAEIVYGDENAYVKFLVAGPKVYLLLDAVKHIRHKCCIVNLRCVKPLDEELLRKICKDIVIVVEENTIIGGVFSAISEFVVRNELKARVYPIAIPDEFQTFGKKSLIEQRIGFSVEHIVNFVNSFT